MEPVSNQALSLTARAVLGKLRSLTQETYSEKLVARAVDKLGPDMPRPKDREQREIRRLFADESTWHLLVHPSLQVNGKLVDRICAVLSPERPVEINARLASELAGLAVSEFLGALDPEHRANVAAELSRYIADEITETRRRVEELVRASLGGPH